MNVLKKTEVSLLGYGYLLTEERGSKQPYAVECLKDGELFEIEFFANKKSAEAFFNSSRTTLEVV